MFPRNLSGCFPEGVIPKEVKSTNASVELLWLLLVGKGSVYNLNYMSRYLPSKWGGFYNAAMIANTLAMRDNAAHEVEMYMGGSAGELLLRANFELHQQRLVALMQRRDLSAENLEFLQGGALFENLRVICKDATLQDQEGSGCVDTTDDFERELTPEFLDRCMIRATVNLDM